MVEVEEYQCDIGKQQIYIKFYIADIHRMSPTVIFSHGLSLNHTFMLEYAYKLSKFNINCVLFDFRGGGYGSLSDGEVCDMSLLTEVDDLNCVTDFIKTFDFVDNDKIYLAGHSQGGFISSLAASQRCDIKALFLFSPAYIILSDVRNTDNMRDRNVLGLMPDDLGDKYINDALKVNLKEDIGNFKNPVYIFQGTDDLRVPPESICEVIDIYENCNLILFENEEHRFTSAAKDVVVNKMRDEILD